MQNPETPLGAGVKTQLSFPSKAVPVLLSQAPPGFLLFGSLYILFIYKDVYPALPKRFRVAYINRQTTHRQDFTNNTPKLKNSNSPPSPSYQFLANPSPPQANLMPILIMPLNHHWHTGIRNLFLFPALLAHSTPLPSLTPRGNASTLLPCPF